MADREHRYHIALEWTGNTGRGTADYRAYERSYLITATGKPPIVGSSDPSLRGDPARWNPEEMLLAAISACHQLWYLHSCADAGITVVTYQDKAEAWMIENDGGGRFTRAVLRPEVTITASSNREHALELHHEAHTKCFVASSLNFPVTHEPTVRFDGSS